MNTMNDAASKLHPAPVPRDLAGLHLVEVDQRDPDRVHELDITRARLETGPHALEFQVEHAPRDVVLGREVAEERPPADAGGGRDVLDRGLLEPVHGEQLERDLLQLGMRGDTPASRLAAAVLTTAGRNVRRR